MNPDVEMQSLLAIYASRSNVRSNRLQCPSRAALLPSVELPPPAPFLRRNRGSNQGSVQSRNETNARGEAAASPPFGPLTDQEESKENDLVNCQITYKTNACELSSFDIQFLSLLDLEYPALLSGSIDLNVQ